MIADRCPGRFSDKDKTQSADSDSGKKETTTVTVANKETKKETNWV